jgi:starch-binding outer membrane protein, SusD/RagB family
LRDKDYPGMMAILNGLRASPPKLGEVQPPVMAALPVPADSATAVSLYFREKAFWTFTRGQRLGDLRRLIRQYGRTEDTTFPSGVHYKGPDYGDDVNLPVPKNEEGNNPNFHGCLDRNA